MKKIILCLTLVIFSIFIYYPSNAQFVVESLDGPVTQNEINAFKTWAQGIKISSSWTPAIGNLSYGSTDGAKMESLGLMYEMTKEKDILDALLRYTDATLYRRNDPNTGDLEWTGKRELIWYPLEVRTGLEQGMIVAKILYAAQLILQSPAIWNSTVPDGNPFGYGATYHERAIKYIDEMEKTESTFLLKYHVRTSDKHIIFPNDTLFDGGTGGYLGPFNQMWMFCYGIMRMAKCYELLGNTAMEKKYHDIVQANLNLYTSKMFPATYQGHDAYIWYYPVYNSTRAEDIGHGVHGVTSLMFLDLYKGYTNFPDGLKMANAIRYACYKEATNEWNYNVAGTDITNYPTIQSGYVFLGRYLPDLYYTIGNDMIRENKINIKNGYQTTAYLLWVKNARYTGTWDSPLECKFTAIVPYTRINGGTWNKTTNAILNTGDKVDFGPQPTSGGSWSWTGPNGFTSSSRQITISNIQNNQAGNYVATYTNSCGVSSTATFTICTSTPIDPYMEVNGSTWDNISSVTVNVGEEAGLGPHPTSGGSWSWTGPNGFTSTNRWFRITNIQTNQGGNYVATYTNDCGATSTAAMTVIVNQPCTPTPVDPYMEVNGGTWNNVSTVTVNVGGEAGLGPHPTTGGSWSWVGPNGFTSANRWFKITNIQSNQAGNYVATYTNAQGCTSTSTMTVKVNAVTNVAPTVSISAPSNNATYTAPASATINATAADSDGSISKVDFYSGNTLLGTDNSSPYSYNWTNVAAGTYSITVRATDNAGAVTTSAAINITVKASTNTCSGVSQYVENGNYVADSKVQNAGSQYQCKPYPYSGWCNGAAWAYAPGTGSYWQDAWTLVGSCTAAKTAASTTASGVVLITNAPNPFGSTTTITVNVETAGEISVIVYDQLGREVAVLVNGYLTADAYSFNLDGSDLKNGIYVCRFVNNDKVISSTIAKQ